MILLHHCIVKMHFKIHFTSVFIVSLLKAISKKDILNVYILLVYTVLCMS